VEKKRIDVKLGFNRFTYDPEALTKFTPVALQARGFCGVRDRVVFMTLGVPQIRELHEFLGSVLWQVGLMGVGKNG
jgi:hypothetical protein